MTCRNFSKRAKSSTHPYSRRDFLRSMSATTAALLVGAASNRQVYGSVAGDKSKVALAEATSYDPKLLRQVMESMMNDLGGLGDLVKPGDSVGFKINLTAGTASARNYENETGLAATETFWSHPEILRAIGGLFKDAGASRLYVFEALYDKNSYTDFGFKEVVDYLGATFIDTEKPKEGGFASDFVKRPVGDKSIIFHTFTQHAVYDNLDCFVSLAKAKAHQSAGITHGLKNQIGSVPRTAGIYTDGKTWRSGLHTIRVSDSSDADKNTVPDNNVHANLQRTILDLNNAAPFHLVINDAIMTVAGGENPQQRDPITPITFNKLIASKDPIAADAIATQVCGFDPMDSSTWIVDDGINYLKKAAELGMGNYDLSKIDVIESKPTRVVESKDALAQKNGSISNFPNPLNDRTVFQINLPEAGYARVDIYTIAGTRIRQLVSRSLSRGVNKIEWNTRDDFGRSVPTGIYFAKLYFNGGQQSHKVSVIK